MRFAITFLAGASTHSRIHCSIGVQGHSKYRMSHSSRLFSLDRRFVQHEATFAHKCHYIGKMPASLVCSHTHKRARARECAIRFLFLWHFSGFSSECGVAFSILMKRNLIDVSSIVKCRCGTRNCPLAFFVRADSTKRKVKVVICRIWCADTHFTCGACVCAHSSASSSLRGSITTITFFFLFFHKFVVN